MPLVHIYISVSWGLGYYIDYVDIPHKGSEKRFQANLGIIDAQPYIFGIGYSISINIEPIKNHIYILYLVRDPEIAVV